MHIEREDRTIDFENDVEFVSGWGDIIFGGDSLGAAGRFSGMSKKINWVPVSNIYEGQCVEN